MKFPTVFFIIGERSSGKSVLANIVEAQGFMVVRTWLQQHNAIALSEAYQRGDSIFVDVNCNSTMDGVLQAQQLVPFFQRIGYGVFKALSISDSPRPKRKKATKKKNNRRGGYSRSSG